MLKSHDKLQTEQQTTTKRRNVTTEKILPWHGTCDEAMEEMDCLNSWYPEWDNIKKSKTVDRFWGNTDENSMTASGGTIKILGSNFVKTHDLNTNDNHDSITINHSGSASGAEGPRMFLIKSKKVDNDCFKKFQRSIIPQLVQW